MKVIDLLNKIANGEESRLNYHKFSQDDYCTVDDFFSRYIVDEENLNLEIIEDTPKEDKKIEKLDLTFEDKFIKENFGSGGISYLDTYTTLKMIYNKQCEIIDKINEKEANNENN